MNKIRRIFSTILILVLFLNMISPVHAEESDPGKLTMAVSDSSVDHGDLVTVTISANLSFVTRGAGMTIAYDPKVLEPVLENCTTAAPLTVSGPLTAGEKTVLRISSFPGEEGHTFTADEALAVLAFRTLTPVENSTIEMTAAYLYDTALNRIGLQIAEPVQISIAAVPVTGITLEMGQLDLELGQSRQVQAVIAPANASDQTILWTSSDESIVTVEDGVLTGIGIGTATITATAGGFTAECTVTVDYPPDAGYIMAMPGDKATIVGDSITISPIIDNAEEISVYNAYHITISYDPTMLLLTSTQMEDVTVTAEDGLVSLLHYGPDQQIGSVPFDLMFTALHTGETTVTVTSARVDHSENAVISNTALASLYPGATKIAIGGYPVSLPDEFSGDTVVEPGADYTFEAKDKLYDYTFENSTMGGQSVTVKDNGDGTYTVENVTGRLVIQTQKTGKTFAVVFDGSGKADMKGNSTAQ